DAAEARDLGVARLDQGAPVVLGRREAPAVVGRGLEMVGEQGGVAHQLLGDAAADHAGATDARRLAQRHLGAIGAGPARARDAARAAADHEQIEIRQARRSPLALPRAATAPGLALPAEDFNRFGAAAAARSAARLPPDLRQGLAQLVEAGVVVVRHARLIALFGEIRSRLLRVLAGLGAFQRIAELLRQGRAVDAFSDVDLLRQRRGAEARRR